MTDRSATVPVSADGGASNARLGAAYLEVKLYANTHAYDATVKWFDALITAQQAYMTTCNAARLEAAQIRVKQLMALRNALAAPGGASTGHCFD